MTPEIDLIIEKLYLEPHPEGGYYKEVYRSEGIVSKSSLPPGIDGERNYCTSIYFLLTSENFSAFHRIKQDEIWNFYAGSPLNIHLIDEKGNYACQSVGNTISKGLFPQFVVPANTWFASEVPGNNYALVGCTVSPGFDFEDFELGSRAQLAAQYPEHSQIINRLTR